LLDATGAVVRRYRYQPYGADDSPTGSWTTTTPIQYAGGQLDKTPSINTPASPKPIVTRT
jgi:hypothetical protein